MRHARAFAGGGVLERLVTADGQHARISGRMVDEGGYVHSRKNAELRRLHRRIHGRSRVRRPSTRPAWPILIDRNNAHLSRQMLLSLGSSLPADRRDHGLGVPQTARVVLVALLPNVVPLFFIAGLMGVLGIDLKVSTAIIFSNAFGIAVDDTIHLLAKLRIELAPWLVACPMR